jgi:SAM-dependent methyltransferase
MCTQAAPDTARYYEEFSLKVGAQDWRRDNGRHLRIRQELVRLLGPARDLRVLDVGCGAGVLSSYLCRYGQVTGTDLSGPAVALARVMEPRANFVAGRFEELEFSSRFDLITLFDVLEHVPPNERPALFARVNELLSERGWLVLTTPHPTFTRWLGANHPQLLQIVDKPVPPDDVIGFAASNGLHLIDFRVYEVDPPGTWRFPGWQYQLFAFARPSEHALPLPNGRSWRGLRVAASPIKPVRRSWRIGHALRLGLAGQGRAALWLLGGNTPPASQSRQ